MRRIDWPETQGIRGMLPTLDLANQKHGAFVALARRASGGASYAVLGAGAAPWHAAMAAPYAHATAPMRRLTDRYTLDLLHAQMNNESIDPGRLSELPAVMERAERAAARVDRACLDLAECVLLRGRVGETFEATVIDADDRGATVQLLEPAVRARTRLLGVLPGAVAQLRLVKVDLEEHRLSFESA